MASPELSVVCKSCGAEVSPYVTECPYCGARLRRRAPKLEREGDEIRVREGRRERRQRKAAERRERRERKALARGLGFATERPYVTIVAIAAPAVWLVAQSALDWGAYQGGAIVGDVGSQWWRYFSAPFVFDDAGYLFAVGLAVALFLPTVERRLGPLAAVLLVVAAGSLGMLATVGLDNGLGDGFVVAGGGNGIALGALGAWFALRRADARLDPDEAPDTIAVVVAAAVLIALPVVVDLADFWAGLAGGVVGLGAGFAAGRRR